MPKITDLRSFADHRSVVGSLIPKTAVVDLPLAHCLGLALAEDVSARNSLPAFDNSSMDGYAVVAGDLIGANVDKPVILPVVDDIPAGRTDLIKLNPGTAMRIMTGAPLPRGANSVVPVEWTDSGTDQVAVRSEVSPGAHIRRIGEDVVAGTTVLPAGIELGPAQLGLAAAVGAVTLPVHRRLRVLIVSTGSELVEPGQPLKHGQIYESNGTMLAASACRAGAQPTLLRFVPDDPAAFHEALRPYLAEVEVIVTSGGISAGAYEVVKEALREHGVEFVKVAMQPGMPQGTGHYFGIPVVTLPGNPVSAHLSFELFLRPAFLAAMGHASTETQRMTARITTNLSSPKGKRQFRRAVYHAESNTVSPIGGPGSHLLSALAKANCLIELPEPVVDITEGSMVDVVMLQ